MAETLLVNVKVNKEAAQKSIDSLLKPRQLNVDVHINKNSLASLNAALKSPRVVKVKLDINKESLKPLKQLDKYANSIGKSLSGGGSKGAGGFAKSVKTYTDSANKIQKAMTKVHNEIKAQQDHLRKYGKSMTAQQRDATKGYITDLEKMFKDAEKIYKKHSKYGKRKFGATGRGELESILQNTDRSLTNVKEKRAGSAKTASVISANQKEYKKILQNKQKQQAQQQKMQEVADRKRQKQLVASGNAIYKEQQRQVKQQQKIIEQANKDAIKQQQLRDKQLSNMREKSDSKMQNVEKMHSGFSDRRNSLTSQQTSDWNREYQKAQNARAAMAKLDQKYQGQKATGAYVGQYAGEYKNLTKAQAAMQSLELAHKNYIKSINGPQNEAVYFDKMGAKMSDYFNKFGHNLQKNQALYEKYLSLQNKANSGGFASMRDANNQWAQFRTEARKAGAEIDTFGSKLQRTFGSRIRSATAGMGVFAIQSALRGIVESAKEVDTAMTELKKVTFESGDTYDKFLENAGGRAQKIGATLRDTVSATADFARLGYNIDEATKLADSALIYKNVGDDVDTIDDATKAIISTMQGFNIEAENSMDIVDKFDWVADNYASSAGDIGQITQRSAAAMAAAGNTLDETIALGVAANEVQQDADTVGTALKTMSMRLRGSKTDMEAAGLDTEGMATSVSKLRDELISLSGVDIMKNEDTFKSSYDILIGMGEVWDNLSDINRANITELLFGKRRKIVSIYGDIYCKTHLIAGTSFGTICSEDL